MVIFLEDVGQDLSRLNLVTSLMQILGNVCGNRSSIPNQSWCWIRGPWTSQANKIFHREKAAWLQTHKMKLRTWTSPPLVVNYVNLPSASLLLPKSWQKLWLYKLMEKNYSCTWWPQSILSELKATIAIYCPKKGPTCILDCPSDPRQWRRRVNLSLSQESLHIFRLRARRPWEPCSSLN